MPLDRLLKENLSLGGLTMPDLSREAVHAIRDESEKEIAEYRVKYGDGWYKQWREDQGDGSGGDMDANLLNAMILYGTNAGCCHPHEFEQLELRMRELYGDAYEVLKDHESWDARVVELLLSEAVRTGKWKRLPKELWPEYRKRVGSIT